MSEEWEQRDFGYLKGKPPTEKQLWHLKNDLFYDGPEITDAYEASQLIDILRADLTVRSRQAYEQRMKEGANWLVWEKWMFKSRRDYDKEQWQRWWAETRKFGHEAGIVPAQTPPMPAEWKKSQYSTVQELMEEIREVLGLTAGSEIRLEVTVGSMEDAINVREKIAEMRESLRTIDDDAAWMLARIRGAGHGEYLIGELFEANAGGRWRGVQLGRDEFRVLKKGLVGTYSYVRGVVKTLTGQMREFLKQVNAVYKK